MAPAQHLLLQEWHQLVLQEWWLCHHLLQHRQRPHHHRLPSAAACWPHRACASAALMLLPLLPWLPPLQQLLACPLQALPAAQAHRLQLQVPLLLRAVHGVWSSGLWRLGQLRVWHLPGPQPGPQAQLLLQHRQLLLPCPCGWHVLLSLVPL